MSFSNETETELFLDGVDDRPTLAPGSAMMFEALVVGRAVGGNSGGRTVRGLIKRVGDTTTLVG